VNSYAGKRTVVVTGTSTGIGRSCALRLSAQGYRVIAGVRKESDGKDLQAAARGALDPVILDITDESNVKEVSRYVADVTGGTGIAGLVNNAGAAVTSPVELVPMDMIHHSFETNFFGPLGVIQEFLPQLRQGTGRLINVGSIGNVVMPFAAPLNAAKWALAAVNHALRVELRPWGIHVVFIEPVSIKTAGIDKLEEGGLRNLANFSEYERGLYEEAYRSMLRKAAMHVRRLGTSPEAVAKVVLRAMTAERPKERYLVGKSARPLAGMVKYSPDWLYDLIRLKVFGLPSEFGARAVTSPPSGLLSTGPAR
jgi:NAD(P)-dependent dehydrogenase (short-subunit alcohol dehydrogenase family)